MIVANISPSMNKIPDSLLLWKKMIRDFIDQSLLNKAEIIFFPELYLMSLACFVDAEDEKKQLELVADLLQKDVCPWLTEFLPEDIFLVFSTGPRRDGDVLKNTCYIHSQGNWMYQDKMYLTPWENHFTSGDTLQIFQFKSFKISILVCFDSEHPDLSIILKDKNINLLLVPTATTNKMGNLRVNRCASARAVELGAVVITNPLVGDCKIEIVDHHEGCQGIFYPAQDLSPSETEQFSNYSVNESLINFIDVNETYLMQLKLKTSETKPYHSITKKIICAP